jgi:DNA-binding response OmpR family regulator
VIKSEPAKVLIADDEEDTRQFLVEFLNELGHTVTAVASGKQAITAATNELPDVILLDVMMPEMSGLEACQILKEQPETKDIPIIFVTAKATVNDQLKGLHIGAHDYINKPYRITELAARLNAAVRVKKMHDELKKRTREMHELTQAMDKYIRDPLEKTEQLTSELLKRRFSANTRDSLAKLNNYVSSSLEHVRSLLEKNPG